MRIRLLPYKAGSVSAGKLARELGVMRVSLTSSRIRDTENLLVVNWGNGSNVPANLSGALFLNKPNRVATAANKLEALRVMEEGRVPITPYTTSRDTVREWLLEGESVVVRSILTGNSGAGITIIRGEETEIPEAPLYTKYVKKRDEFRVHVGRSPLNNCYEVLAVQRKARSRTVPDDEVNWQVRNRNNGFIFQRNDVVLPDEPLLLSQAKNAVIALGLDFGAVDLGYNSHTGEATIYEVNTACGLEGTTLENYTNFINGWIERYEP